MNSRNEKIVDLFRAEALLRDIPAADVERWLELTRPCALLTQNGAGPVVGAVRGPVLLPDDVPDPGLPLIVTVDCAALPAGVTDLPLPPDGQLLLFGWPEEDGWGEVRYVPAGVPTRERPRYPENFPPEEPEYAEVYAELPPSDLRLTADVSLPYMGPVPGHHHAEELTSVWRKVLGSEADGIFAHHGSRTPMLLGGFGTEDNGADPVQAVLRFVEEMEGVEDEENTADWLLLGEFHGGRQGGATIFWMIRRADLATHRFENARVLVDWNP
ncbi:hypothetical protein FB565_008184 [Actinoplanes lutulentus]|uniref:DUF1963 domain-containing protein n=1 Tax=Actinoplanes lutulentus TaxID=1287878 RepID=UPI0011B93E20|nr:DUF1963 domain-containing protein [Actinoplanes lutulentus]MBB2948401.1 hypothetical protein [Actinoplanes lutulentus]